MKKTILYGLAVAMAICVGMNVSAKSKVRPTYAFGFAASFTDSTVYFTDIQYLDSSWFDEKSGYIVSREQYSYQLRDYLAGLGEEHRTCVFTYDKDQKKIQKRYDKMLSKYTKKGNFDVKYLKEEDFKFKCIAPFDPE